MPSRRFDPEPAYVSTSKSQLGLPPNRPYQRRTADLGSGIKGCGRSVACSQQKNEKLLPTNLPLDPTVVFISFDASRVLAFLVSQAISIVCAELLRHPLPKIETRMMDV